MKDRSETRFVTICCHLVKEKPFFNDTYSGPIPKWVSNYGICTAGTELPLLAGWYFFNVFSFNLWVGMYLCSLRIKLKYKL